MICMSGLGDASKPGTCHACIVGVLRDVALSEGTSLGHRETRSCVISQIWYGGSWGRMRNAHEIWGRLGDDREFQKKCEGREVTADFPIEMAVNVVVQLG